MIVQDSINYTISHSCNHSGCNDEGICRCGVVEPNPNLVDYPGLLKELYDMFQLGEHTDKLQRYCVDRIARRVHGAHLTKAWMCIGESDYYGENFAGAQFNGSEDFESQLRQLKALPRDARVPYVLSLEYKHVLPQLEYCRFDVETIHISDIHIPNARQLSLAGVSNEYLQVAPVAPLCVVRATPDRTNPYVLIDGYHRLAQVGLKQGTMVEVIVAISNAPIVLDF